MSLLGNFGVWPNQVKGPDGFGPPGLGGIVNVKFAVFNYNDTGIATSETLFALPLGVEIVGIALNVITAFNGTGTNTLDFGIVGNLTAFAAAINAATLGQADSGWTPSALFTQTTGEDDVTVRYNGTTPSAGKAVFAIFYIERSKQ